MSQGPLCPNLTQKVQREVSQMANLNFSCVMLLGGLSVNLNHLKTDKLANAYFHLQDLACLRRVPDLSNITVDHIYIEDGVYHSLTEGHLEILDRRGHLSALKRIRAILIKRKKK